MALITAPLLSIDASGSIAGAIVFSKWKGRNYVRSLVKPANPRSGGQVGMRSMFKWLSQQWQLLADADKATWEDRADQGIYSPFNGYMSYNMRRWRDFTSPSQVDPAGTSDVQPVLGVATAVAGVRSITVSQPVTTQNDGWGVAVFRSLSTGFATAFDNLMAIGDIDGIDPAVIVDSPLVPDTYYYNLRAITKDGQLGPEEGEISAVVT